MVLAREGQQGLPGGSRVAAAEQLLFLDPRFLNAGAIARVRALAVRAERRQ
jgi:hypothetical protein